MYECLLWRNTARKRLSILTSIKGPDSEASRLKKHVQQLPITPTQLNSEEEQESTGAFVESEDEVDLPYVIVKRGMLVVQMQELQDEVQIHPGSCCKPEIVKEDTPSNFSVP